MRDIKSRIIATLVAAIGYVVLNIFYAPQATLLSGQVAGKQFQNSDTAYTTSVYVMRFLSGLGGLFTLLFLAVLLIIWITPIRELVKRVKTLFVVVLTIGGTILFGATNSHGYYEKSDYTQAYTILPNESAFWIPDAGANKDSQSQFDSEDYLKANKVAVKRFVVPHAKLSGTGAFFDYYVPSGRLIIVDRTPFSREWVAATDRGTSHKNESFPCQSKEGLNIGIAVSAGASVLEANAAKYLYRFGVLPAVGERSDPKVIFSSVYYSRKVADVMDDVGRKKIQTLVCQEIAARKFDQANEDMNLIMETTRTSATEYFASIGITLDFLGYADEWKFDSDVQKAVNDSYAAIKLAPVLSVLQALAQLKIQEGLGKGLGDKGLPIVVTPDMINTLIGLVRSAPTP